MAHRHRPQDEDPTAMGREWFDREYDGKTVYRRLWGYARRYKGIILAGLLLGMLTGVLIVLGRISANNEIVAMKSAGMNLWRIVSPIFLVALIGVALSGYINCFWAPRAATSPCARLPRCGRRTKCMCARRRIPRYKVYETRGSGMRASMRSTNMPAVTRI